MRTLRKCRECGKGIPSDAGKCECLTCSECDESGKPMMPEGNETGSPCCVECWVN